AAGTWLTSLGLSSHGFLIDHATIAGGVLTAFASDNHQVFTLSLNGTTGAWTFTLINPIDHASDAGENTASVKLAGLIHAADFDLDAVTLSGDFSITVTDDIPQLASGQATSGSVDEGGLTFSATTGDKYGTGNDPGFAITATGTLSGLVNFGADGASATPYQ